MTDVVLPVLDERKALPWVLARLPAGYVPLVVADGSLDPRDLPRVVAGLGDADLVLGARCADPGAWPLHARLANRALALELRRRSGAALTDLGPMRAAPRRALLELALRDRRFGY